MFKTEHDLSCYIGKHVCTKSCKFLRKIEADLAALKNIFIRIKYYQLHFILLILQ